MKKDKQIAELRQHARNVRRHILRLIHESGSDGHYGGSLSCVEILTCLYFKAMRHRPQDPAWEERDRFILSKGHAAPALYAVLAESGYFALEHLSTYKRLGSILQGHPDMKLTPGVEMSTGSLGQGLAVGLGMAWAGKLDGKSYRVYVLLGDGEIEEGSVWEAALAAAHYRLDNLTAILDRNGLQISGPTEEHMRLEPLADKWRSFGWAVGETDGHDIGRILEVLESSGRSAGRPALIVANTVKGKGIAFLENRKESHSCSLSEQQHRQVLQSLEHGN